MNVPNKSVRWGIYYKGLTPATPMCINCEFYHMHYVHYDDRYHKIDAGHCGKRRLKAVNACDTCEQFRQIDGLEVDADAFWAELAQEAQISGRR